MHQHTIRQRLLICLWLVTCCFVALLTTPAYFRMRHIQWKNGSILLPEGQDTFTIVQFADLHFGEDDMKDEKSKQVMQSVLLAEHETDLIVFSGDQVSGWLIQNPLEALRRWADALETANILSIPFATIFGNHDDQAWHMGHMIQYHVAQGLLAIGIVIGLAFASQQKYSPKINLALASMSAFVFIFAPSNIMRRSLSHYEQARFPNVSMSREGPSNMHGLSNYVLSVGHENQTVPIFLLDSGGGRLDEKYSDRQLKWVLSTTQVLNSQVGIAFAHIPSTAFGDALLDRERFRCIGDNDTEPVMSAMTEYLSPMHTLALAGIKAIFSGHDHRNSYCCIPKDRQTHSLAMCYGRHTGYGGYGDWMRGARVIRLNLSTHPSAIQTWLRMEDGSRLDFVQLT